MRRSGFHSARAGPRLAMTKLAGRSCCAGMTVGALTCHNEAVTEASSPDVIVSAEPARREHVPLGIAYMVAATILFAASSAASKWLVATYPVGEVLFTRTAVVAHHLRAVHPAADRSRRLSHAAAEPRT